MKYLSRVFTLDKSCAFPLFLWKMSLNSSFFILRTLGGKHVTNRLWLVLNLLDLELACRLDSTLRFQIAPSIPREPAPAPIEHYFESDIELRDLTTKVFVQCGTSTGETGPQSSQNKVWRSSDSSKSSKINDFCRFSQGGTLSICDSGNHFGTTKSKVQE